MKGVSKKTKEMSLTVASSDLLVEILMRLPMKSLMRFKCVSKPWLSLISSSRYLTNLLLQPSSSRERLFAYLVDIEDEQSMLASSSHDHDHSDILIDKDLTLPGMGGYWVNANRGFLYFKLENTVRICKQSQDKKNYFGQDLVHDEYKVLNVISDYAKELSLRSSENNQVLVLGPGDSLRTVKYNIPHTSFPCFNPRGMAINGVLYYGAYLSFEFVLMSFNLSYEEFNVIHFPYEFNKVTLSRVSLMNYKGKVAFLDYNLVWEEGATLDVRVLEDAEKSLWSEEETFVLPLSQTNIVHGDDVRIGCTSHSCKVWLAKEIPRENQSEPVRIFIYGLDKNEIMQKIQIRPLPYGTQLSSS